MANASPKSEKNFQKNARQIQEYLDGKRKNGTIISTHHIARRLERRFKTITLKEIKELDSNYDLYIFRILQN